MRLNGFDNVVAVEKAASNENGSTTFHYMEVARGDGRIYEPGDSGLLQKVLGNPERKTVEVETIRLDDYFRDREEGVQFVKIDTQGAEAAIVAGMLELGARSADLRMVVEWTPNLLREIAQRPAALPGPG